MSERSEHFSFAGRAAGNGETRQRARKGMRLVGYEPKAYAPKPWTSCAPSLESSSQGYSHGSMQYFPTLPCGVLVFFAAPPRSSAFLLPPPLSHKSSLTQHHSHNIYHTLSLTQHLSQQHLTHNITHTTSHTTTSLTQHPTHNISHTTSLTQHLSQQHLTRNITHTTSHTQHLAYNIAHTTSPTTQHLTHNISDRYHLRAVCGACCLPRGRMYALALSGAGWAPALCR